MFEKNLIYSLTDVKNQREFISYIDSIYANCECTTIIDIPEDIEKVNRLKDECNEQYFVINSIPPNMWNNRRMYCKFQLAIKNVFKDNVKTAFILDTDVNIQDDIFELTDTLDFDLAVTTRHYEYWYPVNAGVWAVRNNVKTQKLMRFLLDQIQNPTWQPYIDWMKKFNRPSDTKSRLDWWCDQDMLCLAWLNREWIKSEFDVNVVDLGPKFNWCPSVEEKKPETYEIAKADILSKIGDTEYKILHFKGRLKGLMS